MSGAFDGDLIRPLGFVTLYAAYAEGELDELIESLMRNDQYGDSMRQWTIGRKLNHALELTRSHSADCLHELESILLSAKDLFKRRNELVHGRLYAGGKLVSNRRDIQEQKVSPEAIQELADEIWSWKEQVFVHRCRNLLPLLERETKSDT